MAEHDAARHEGYARHHGAVAEHPDHLRRLAQRSEQIGYDLTLIAELYLNDIKGMDAPSLDAWSTAAALFVLGALLFARRRQVSLALIALLYLLVPARAAADGFDSELFKPATSSTPSTPATTPSFTSTRSFASAGSTRRPSCRPPTPSAPGASGSEHATTQSRLGRREYAAVTIVPQNSFVISETSP